MFPSGAKAGRNRPSEAVSTSGRIPSSSTTTTGSPRRCGTWTGTISSARRPAERALDDRSCEAAASASWGPRVIPISPAWRSVASPIAQCSIVQVRPSASIESTSVASPALRPERAPWSMYGAFVIDSIPPATTTSASPRRIIWLARWIACIPERHARFRSVDGAVRGMPASLVARLAGTWPTPAEITFPM